MIPVRRWPLFAYLLAGLTVAHLVVRSARFLPAAGWALGGLYAGAAVLCAARWPVGLLPVAALATATWLLVRDLPERVRGLGDGLDELWREFREGGAP